MAACSHCQLAPLDVVAGDQFYFLGNDELSRAIACKTANWRQWLIGPKFSHVAIAADVPASIITPHYCGRVLLFESTTMCRSPCVLKGALIDGVQAHDPARRVAEYPGQVWRLRLTDPLEEEERRKLSAFLLNEIGKPYDWKRALRLAGRHFDAAMLAPTAGARFCSELNAVGLKRVDRIGRDHDPEALSPNSLARLMLHSGEVWPIGQGGSEKVK